AVRAVGSGRELLDQAATAPPAAFVIDIGLPDSDGRDVCQALRAHGITAPVLFLTARDALTDRLSGFSAGGDDYVTKPFDIEEVLARLHALLRRHDPSSGVAAQASCLALDPAELVVRCGTVTQALTPTEFRLLGALAGRNARVASRQELIGTAWPHG